MSFQNRFKEFRESLGLTQHEMAARLHKQQPDISKIENGEKDLTVTEMDEFRKAFHLSHDVLLYITYGIDSNTSPMMIRERFEDEETNRLVEYFESHESFKRLLSRITLLPDKNQQYIEQIMNTIISNEEKRK